MKKKTLKNSFTMEGKTIINNYPVKMVCEPYDKGIVFEYEDIERPADISKAKPDVEHLTTVVSGITGIEHLLSAFYGLGIDCVKIKLDQNQPPFQPNSIAFAEAIIKAGSEELEEDRQYYTANLMTEGDGGGRINMKRGEAGLIISSTVSYNNFLGDQIYKDFILTPSMYIQELAEARTYLAVPLDPKDYVYENKCREFKLFPKNKYDCPYVLYTKDKYIVKPTLSVEAARHKMLDFLGDLTLLGKRITGVITLYKTGHRLNLKFLRNLDKLL